MSSPNLAPSFKFITLGCKVNQYDTQLLRESVVAAGLRPAGRVEPADLVVVNTCTVTSVSDEKCRQYIRKAIRDNPTATVAVTGCYVDRDRAAVEAIDGVHHVLPNDEKSSIALIARSIAGSRNQHLEAGRGISDFADHTRAFVKIEDGCDAYCSYCIVPHVRGPVRSRPLGEIVAEVQRLVAAGFREIVLTGIHLGAYGKDAKDGISLPAVVRGLLEATDVERIRLSSIEAMEVGDELLGSIASSVRVCPHLHIPLQSGDDEVLARMNRRYTSDQFLEQVARIRAVLDRPAITSDVMVGFPGETAEQFGHTISTCRAAELSRMHIFPFSPREGTPAASLANRCCPAEIAKRKTQLGEVANELQHGFEREWMAETCRVLIEHRRDRHTRKLRGYSERYINVLLDDDDELMGRIVPVQLTHSQGGYMEGTVLQDGPQSPDQFGHGADGLRRPSER